MGTDANRFIGRIKYQVLNLSDRLRLQDVISSSSSFASLLTWDELTSVPQRISTISETLRVLTPLTYISAMASLRARSLRMPFSMQLG